jgi:hypothetical protein
MAAQSAGNVLYLRELVMGAVEQGALCAGDGVWRLTGLGVVVSNRLVEFIEARLADVSDGERRHGPGRRRPPRRGAAAGPGVDGDDDGGPDPGHELLRSSAAVARAGGDRVREAKALHDLARLGDALASV